MQIINTDHIIILMTSSPCRPGPTPPSLSACNIEKLGMGLHEAGRTLRQDHDHRVGILYTGMAQTCP